MKTTLLRFDVLDSTNTEAAKHARGGAAEGLCILAKRQTAGRGRQGRVWHSDEDAGLYFSIVLRPKLDVTSLPLVTLMAGVAVHSMLADLGITADIKWVNDLLVEEKKIAGILAEAIETPHGLAVILGIGLNLDGSNLPADLSGSSTSIKQVLGRAITPDEAAELLLTHLIGYYDLLARAEGPQRTLEEWEHRSSFFRGKAVRVSTGDVVITGTTDGLEVNGALRVITADGTLRVIQAGDVERVRANVD